MESPGPNEGADSLREKHRPLSREARARRRAVFFAVLSALLAACFLYVAIDNGTRADRWRARSLAAERNAKELNKLLVARTAKLNAVAQRAVEARDALEASESDVASLESRQAELAAEKAQVEDAVAQLADVARAYVTCKSWLTETVKAISYRDWGWIDRNISTVDYYCNSADDELRRFVDAAGG